MTTTFVIDRSKWRCGDCGPFRRGIGDTFLCNDEGFQCCLGQIAIQLGLDETSCIRVPTPDEVTIKGHERVTGVLIRSSDDAIRLLNTDFADGAIEINDDQFLNDTQRERALERLAEEYGLRIEFVGEYAAVDEQ